MSDRLPMSAALPAEVAERLSDVQHFVISSDDRRQAREELADKLRDGKKVGGSDIWDLLDHELNTDRYRVLLETLGGLLLGCEAEERDQQAERLRDELIERHLDSVPHRVEEEAFEIAENKCA